MKYIKIVAAVLISVLGGVIDASTGPTKPLATNFVFANGFWGPKCTADVAKVIGLYQKNGVLSDHVDFPLFDDVYTQRPWNTYLGQEDDVRKLVTECQQKKPYVLYGCSRGGYAIYNILTNTHRLNDLVQTPLRAIIVEAAPSDILDTNHKVFAENFIGWKLPRFFAAGLASLVTRERYNYFHVPPVQVNKETVTIPDSLKNIPILIIHSQTDMLVQHAHACKMYTKLKELGYTNVSFYSLPYGRHTHTGKEGLQTFETPEGLMVLKDFYEKNRISIPEKTSLADANSLKFVAKPIQTMQSDVQKIDDMYNKSAKNSTRTRMLLVGVLATAGKSPWIAAGAGVCCLALSVWNHFKRIAEQDIAFEKRTKKSSKSNNE